jgi:hypothetical protein
MRKLSCKLTMRGVVLIALAVAQMQMSGRPTDGQCCGGTVQLPPDQFENSTCEPTLGFFGIKCKGGCTGVELTMGEYCLDQGTINAGTACTTSTRPQIRTVYSGSCNPADCSCVVNFAVVLASAPTGGNLSTAACL